MFIKITAKRQVTFPAHVLDALGVKPGDRIEIEKVRTVICCARAVSIRHALRRYLEAAHELRIPMAGGEAIPVGYHHEAA